MKKISEYVNVFQGNEKIDLPTPEGIAATWLFIKARCGNTIPAASSPFGKMTLCSYTGGYSTGYGNREWNFCGDAKTFDAKVKGFSHIHASGTGGIGTYYNYALTSPRVDSLGDMSEELVEEKASPGYYFAKLSSGVNFEGTVSSNIAYHRYRSDAPILLQIDFSRSGLLEEFGARYFDAPKYCSVEIISQSRVVAHAKIQGVHIYFAAEAKNANEVFLWENYKERKEKSIILSEGTCNMGAAFRCSENAELRVAISFISCDRAQEMLDSEPDNFDEVYSNTKAKWESYLRRIRIETKSEELKEIFYSNLYHSMIKPCSAFGESYVYDREKYPDFFFDLATMWDLYKTELPLIFTLFPEESKGIVNTLLAMIETDGKSPSNLTISKTTDFSEQAIMLAEHSFADYYYRFKDSDGERIVDATLTDLSAQTDFLESRYCKRYTHILDICEALYAVCDIADEVGKKEVCEKLKKIAAGFVNAYDKNSGLMSESSPYYEGDNWNYSFRLHKNMEQRIALMGRDRFVEALDSFFGFTRAPVVQSLEPNVDPLTPGFHSFEGFNNESDMETPYAYIYAGRHDRTCEVVSAGMKYMFTKGEGGLPGNNDSGGLSSCYIWNALGIFPVTGQNKMLIGSPIVDGAEIKLSNGNRFKITVYNNSESGIFVEKAYLNGREIKDFAFSVREMMNGGHLEIYKTKERTNYEK